ncbi:hypothetical protein RJ640_011174 [Escallonia rubra]|uniref:Transmembrane protein n=1 Tax=Escallonia rubra TaxID=112253 RepID=A0AA88RVL7_9ASTE|nr:hypothetical protein RJ640_011174 [Escallonia rubra]
MVVMLGMVRVVLLGRIYDDGGVRYGEGGCIGYSRGGGVAGVVGAVLMSDGEMVVVGCSGLGVGVGVVLSEVLLSGYIISSTLRRRTHLVQSFSIVFLYWFYVFS